MTAARAAIWACPRSWQAMAARPCGSTARECVDCGAVADFDRTDPYSLGVWFKPRGDGFRTLMGTLDQSDRGFESDSTATSSATSCRNGTGARSRSPRAPPIPMTPGIMSSAPTMARRGARASRFMLTGPKRLSTPRTTASPPRRRTTAIFGSEPGSRGLFPG